MNGNEKQFLEKRLTKLETMMEERWNAHDKRSEEKWAELNNTIGKIFTKVNGQSDTDLNFVKQFGNLPCEAMGEKITGIKWHLRIIWGIIVGIVIAVVRAIV